MCSFMLIATGIISKDEFDKNTSSSDNSTENLKVSNEDAVSVLTNVRFKCEY